MEIKAKLFQILSCLLTQWLSWAKGLLWFVLWESILGRVKLKRSSLMMIRKGLLFNRNWKELLISLGKLELMLL